MKCGKSIEEEGPCDILFVVLSTEFLNTGNIDAHGR